MPADIAAALKQASAMNAYRARPPYQQNDYIGWITRAKRPETHAKRLWQMLDELARGDVYINMEWKPRR